MKQKLFAGALGILSLFFSNALFSAELPIIESNASSTITVSGLPYVHVDGCDDGIRSTADAATRLNEKAEKALKVFKANGYSLVSKHVGTSMACVVDGQLRADITSPRHTYTFSK